MADGMIHLPDIRSVVQELPPSADFKSFAPVALHL